MALKGKRTPLVNTQGRVVELQELVLDEGVAEETVCAREVQALDSRQTQRCGQPVAWHVAGHGLCYKCGLEYALAHLKHTGERLSLVPVLR